MTTLRVINPTSSTATLAGLLVLHSAAQATGGDLLVVGATSIQEARDQLRAMNDDDRVRCLIVGLSEMLCILDFPSPDNLSGLLEEFTPLGVLTFAPASESSNAFGFIGKKSLANVMGTPYMKASASRRYAGYVNLRSEDAGAFVLRYLAAATRSSDPPSEA
jgi:hypothetical protein